MAGQLSESVGGALPVGTLVLLALTGVVATVVTFLVVRRRLDS
ncbi:hypothetical protein [Leucobacter sp. UCMA 4100]|nr:hypothetical protein [Leucobacter sp. UCMA 4100]